MTSEKIFEAVEFLGELGLKEYKAGHLNITKEQLYDYIDIVNKLVDSYLEDK